MALSITAVAADQQSRHCPLTYACLLAHLQATDWRRAARAQPGSHGHAGRPLYPATTRQRRRRLVDESRLPGGLLGLVCRAVPQGKQCVQQHCCMQHRPPLQPSCSATDDPTAQVPWPMMLQPCRMRANTCTPSALWPLAPHGMCPLPCLGKPSTHHMMLLRGAACWPMVPVYGRPCTPSG